MGQSGGGRSLKPLIRCVLRVNFHGNSHVYVYHRAFCPNGTVIVSVKQGKRLLDGILFMLTDKVAGHRYAIVLPTVSRRGQPSEQ